MEPIQESDTRAFWAITWRSILLIPLMLPIAVVWLVIVMSIALLPLFCAASLWLGLLKQAGLFSIIWAAIFYAYRRFRLGRIWEWPPSFL